MAAADAGFWWFATVALLLITALAFVLGRLLERQRTSRDSRDALFGRTRPADFPFRRACKSGRCGRRIRSPAAVHTLLAQRASRLLARRPGGWLVARQCRGARSGSPCARPATGEALAPACVVRPGPS
jgi:hypothetical protein